MINKAYYLGSDSFDPWRNLALEELLLRSVCPGEIILYLWQNKNTVVIGKNQNAPRECALELMAREGVKTARRLSGGGAVYHDSGNLNFTFFSRREDHDVRKDLEVILDAVSSFGIKGEISGRNDMTADGRKFSGNAFCKSGDCCYHHGTIMIDVDKEKLSRYLKPSKAKLLSKGVESVESRVVNLKELCPDIDTESVRSALIESFSKIYGVKAEDYPEDRMKEHEAELESLEKHYSSVGWIFGRASDFEYEYERRFEWGEVRLMLKVEKGTVSGVSLETDAMDGDLPRMAEDCLKGCTFSRAGLKEALEKSESEEISDLIRSI